MPSWSVSRRIAGGFSAVLLVVIGIACIAYFAVQALGNSYSSYRLSSSQTVNVTAFVEDLFEARVAALKYRLDSNESSKSEVIDNIQEIIDFAAAEDSLSKDAVFAETLGQVASSAKAYKLTFLEISDLMLDLIGLREQMTQNGQQARDALKDLSFLAVEGGELSLLAALSEAERSVLLGELYIFDYLSSQNSADADTALGHFDDAIVQARRLEGVVAEAQQTTSSSAGARLKAAQTSLDAVREDLATARMRLDEVIRLSADVLDQSGPQMQAALENMAEMIAERQATLGDQGQQIVSATKWIVPAAGMIATVLALVVAFLVSVSIARPIGRLAKTTALLAQGNTDVAISGAEHDHELGRMAQALQVFRKSYIERNEMTRAAEEAFKDQQNMASALSTGLDALAQGDLNYRVTEKFADEYEALRSNFNAAVEQLNNALNQVGTVSTVISEGAADISVSTNDLSQRTENQAATLEETAAALDELTSSVRGTADRSNEAKEAVQLARDEASRSGEVVRRAVGAMDQIEKSSSEISSITEVISDIAFQTNLLALNAGVEAARAGDAGRGFAVVASEVSALAQRSADAAQDVSNLIDQSAKQIHSGTAQVNAAGGALTNIIERVDSVNALIGEIATISQEQAIGITEISNGVNDLDRVTQQNAGMVEQSTEGGRKLAAQVEELERLMTGFKFGSETDHKIGQLDAIVGDEPDGSMAPALLAG